MLATRHSAVFEPVLRGVANGRLVRSRDWVRAGTTAGAVVIDHLLIVCAIVTAALLRFGEPVSSNTAQIFLAVAPAYALACSAFHSYDLQVLRRASASIPRALISLFTALGLVLAMGYALQVTSSFSRLEASYTFVAAAAYLTLGRLFGSAMLGKVRAAIDPHVVTIGDDSLPSGFQRTPQINVRIAGWSPQVNNPAFLEDLYHAVRDADRVLLMFENTDERQQWASLMRQMSVNSEIIEPSLTGTVPLGVGMWAGLPTLIVSRGPLKLRERVTKRGFDLAVTLAALPIVLPVTLLLMGLVKLETTGPALFAQDRVGRNNRQYRCYKLRTMRTDAADASGERSASREDDRITRLGNLLRKTSLDELPQLWNVLRGDMSLVGPRPHALGSKAEGELFWDVVPEYWSRHAMKPGMTGLAQIRGFRGATHLRTDIEARVAADMEYINTWTLWKDVIILLKTVGVLVHRNAF